MDRFLENAPPFLESYIDYPILGVLFVVGIAILIPCLKEMIFGGRRNYE